ncbi:hypothetical protein BGY98DRAFT_130601 [Russula aff. rugulosa BPL654]|nr:hypothetical protein BGY98DRAFT_130601 [Russula aff. rugulosa BPL654]
MGLPLFTTLCWKASATATEDPAATMRSSGLYGEPRYPTNRSSEKPPFTNVSTSSGMRHTEVCISVVTPHFCPPVDDTQFRMMSWGMIMPEHIAPYPFVLPHRIANNRTSLLQGSHKSANGSSAMGNSLSSNQASHDIERLQNLPASSHQGAALAPHLNSRTERNRLSTAPLGLPPNVQISQDQFDRRTSRALAGDPSLRSTGTPPPQDSAHRNNHQALATETVRAPFTVTPPHSPEKHISSTRPRTSI